MNAVIWMQEFIKQKLQIINGCVEKGMDTEKRTKSSRQKNINKGIKFSTAYYFALQGL